MLLLLEDEALLFCCTWLDGCRLLLPPLLLLAPAAASSVLWPAALPLAPPPLFLFPLPPSLDDPGSIHEKAAFIVREVELGQVCAPPLLLAAVGRVSMVYGVE